MDKTPKKKGPIRVEAIVPFVIIVALLTAYFMLFFDRQLRAGLEWAGTEANGAEVNVGSLRTSFIGGWLRIGDIQVTNPAEPAKNRVRIGEMRFALLWDALLRAKFVVTQAGIDGIEVGTPRKSPGRVLPPPSAEEGKPSVIAKFKEQASRAVLAEAGQLLEGLDPSAKLKDLGKLKSAERVEQLKGELQKKEGEWNSTLTSLPGDKDLAALQAKISAVQAGGNPAEVAKKVAELGKLVKEAEAKVDAVKKGSENLVKDVSSFGGSISQIDELAKLDRQELEKQLQLPSIDAKSLANQLFGNTVLDRVGEAQRYMTMARKYLPMRSAEKPDKAVAEKPARKKGRTYEFGRQNSYPLFWLQTASISSKGEYSAFAGDIRGTLKDVTSSPAQIGRPAVLTLQGDFPKLSIQGVSAVIEADHTKDIPIERIKASVASFPVLEKKISESEGLKFAIAKAEGAARIEALISGDRFRLAMNNVFNKTDYLIAAKSKALESLLKGVTRDLPKVTLSAVVEGTWSDFGLSVQSNLATALQEGLSKQLQAKLVEARRKIDELVQGNIAKGKAELMQRYNDQRSRLTAQVDEKRKKAEAVKAQALARVDQVKGQASSVQRKATDKLKKKLPF
ncbi:MAG: TIGR03545 family protein [Oligoflexia bacterium]|nr:TIGR03545 family protein [Oligoflexia bacterium]